MARAGSLPAFRSAFVQTKTSVLSWFPGHMVTAQRELQGTCGAAFMPVAPVCGVCNAGLDFYLPSCSTTQA